MSELTCIIITHNEALNIEDCLKTLDFCKEVIIVDSGSTDATVSIAEAYGCKIVKTPDWPGYGRQKQRALDLVTTQWALSIDADERVTPDLREEILYAITRNQHSGYLIKRRTNFLGHWMRGGGWYPDFVLRLVRKDHARFDCAAVHEKIIVSGPVGRLNSFFLHFSYRTLGDVFTKQQRYALLSSKKIRSIKGGKISILLSIARAAWTFFRLFFLQRGFIDGRYGLIAAIFKSQEVFWKYVAVEFEPAADTLK